MGVAIPKPITLKRGVKTDITDLVGKSPIFSLGYGEAGAYSEYMYSVKRKGTTTITLLSDAWFTMTVVAEENRIYATQMNWDSMQMYVRIW